MKVLIVDDDAINRKLLRAQLESEGVAVVDASDGVRALQALEEEAVDGIVSDILMPNMDGFRFCLEIRRHAKLAAVPFVFYTSTYNSPQDEQLAASVGADHYILKPSPTHAILAALHEAAQKTRVPSSPTASTMGDETYVLKQYNEALVRKLETKNTELQEALQALRASNRDIVELNRGLESRVRQRTAELEAANQELEAFSYSVSHDLRAPLRAIDGFSSIVLREYASTLPPDGRRYVERVREAAHEMVQLIDDLLLFAQTARHPLAKQAVALESVAYKCLEKFRDDIAHRNVKVVVGVLPECDADPALLQQVLLNLLGNALKYTRQQPQAKIEVGCREQDGEPVIYVKDNGVGFDMKRAERLFGVFQRLHRQDEFEGTGVGLAIVHRIVHRHGGRIWAEAEPGKGATFYFTLGERAA